MRDPIRLICLVRILAHNGFLLNKSSDTTSSWLIANRTPSNSKATPPVYCTLPFLNTIRQLTEKKNAITASLPIYLVWPKTPFDQLQPFDLSLSNSFFLEAQLA